MTNLNLDELLPCPFCGSKIITYDKTGTCFVWCCDECGAQASQEVWNRRAVQEPQAAAEGCTWDGGDEPCPTCPRSVTALHRCCILQDIATPPQSGSTPAKEPKP